MGYSVKHTPEFWEERFGTPECVRNYYIKHYNYLDDLSFMRPAMEVFGDWCHAEKLLEEVARRWKENGWHGDGEIQMIWFPPFVGIGSHNNFGTYALHVKQQDDGDSWLACPVPLTFHRLFDGDPTTYPPPNPNDVPLPPPTGLQKRRAAHREVLEAIFSGTIDSDWAEGKPIPGVRFKLNDAVRVISGAYAGELGSIVSIARLSSNICYNMKTSSGQGVEVLEFELEPASGGA